MIDLQTKLSGIEKIYDMHTHIFPSKIAAKAVDSIGKFYDIDMTEKGTSEDLLEKGKLAGVTRFLVCSTATTGLQVSAINNFIAGECSAHAEFIGFGSVHPDFSQIGSIGDEVDRIVSLGLKGIKLHPDFQHFNIDDPAAYPIYEAAEGRLPVLIHMGDNRYDYSKPFRLLNVTKQFPKLKVIAAHLGGYRCWDEAESLKGYLGNPNIYIDTCSAIQFISRDESLKIIHEHGTDRVFWGTDFPMWNHEVELKRFLELGLTDEENKDILFRNAEKLLGIN